MSEEKIIETIVGLLPSKEIYKDGLQPSVRQVGKLSEDIIKVLRLALFPVQGVALLQDKFERFIKDSVNKVPSDHLIAPPPQILGPTLEAVRYEAIDSEISQMFADLLSSSMDVENVNKAHPSYPLIIRQLSVDEAKILKMLSVKTYEFVRTSKLTPDNRFHHDSIEKDELPRESLAFSDRVDFYFQHLAQLGLAGIYEYKNQEPLTNGSGKQVGVRIFSKYQLTSLGQRFMEACIYDKAFSDRD